MHKLLLLHFGTKKNTALQKKDLPRRCARSQGIISKTAKEGSQLIVAVFSALKTIKGRESFIRLDAQAVEAPPRLSLPRPGRSR